MPPHISVIVPAYQAASTINRCLAALGQQSWPRHGYEIIVVDDGSMDDTRTRIALYPDVQLVIQPNAGPAAARNKGVAHAKGDLVLFTDADCEPATTWIAEMIAPFDNPEIVGVKGAYSGPAGLSPVARFVQIEYEHKCKRMENLEYIDFVDTYSAAYRRDIFLSQGGFDTTFPRATVEDQEFSFRLARQGLKMVYAPRATVKHWGHPATLWAYARRKWSIGYWKAVVARRYPKKMLRDSHTPQSLKLQIALVALGLLCLLLAVAWPQAIWGTAAALAALLVSTLPFIAQAWVKDRLIALISPFLLFVRALTLGAGFAAGLFRTCFSPRRGVKVSTDGS